METLKIEIPKGFKVESFDHSTGEIKLAPIPQDITERIKNFADVLNYHKIDAAKFNEACNGLETDEKAYKQIKLIVSALNEGWVPNWEDDDQWKHYPYFDMDDSSSSGRFSFDGSDNRGSYSDCGSRLCFKSEELSDYAGETFIDIYREFFVIE
ncbi:hypothetical protein [Chryseobacterium sp.]|uniref:hypothetical protein n=1 Tax=Chryseobacterium sp. TaxID=1871047 RepID=UPI00289F4057|nr:hypothetical protein [Chryseobacterium sp.]